MIESLNRARVPMIRISVPYAYDLGKVLQPLSALNPQGTKLTDVLWNLYNAENRVTEFVTQSVYSKALKATQAPAAHLLATIKRLTTQAAGAGIVPGPAQSQDRTLDFMDVFSVSNAIEQFETVLRAELNVADCYLVTQQGGYDTLTLIQNAELLFPPKVSDRAPEARGDIREAGKCLAFEMGTAAGFHILRATEAVLKRYYDAVMNGAARPRNRNLGAYLKKIEEAGVGSNKAIAALQQLRDLHRNPLMHPEDVLTVEDAIALFGIVHSAITAMLKEMPDLPKSPAPDASSQGNAA